MTKKIWAGILVIALLFACSAVVFATGDDLEIMPSVGFRIGDVNMDKDINVKDATLVQKYIAMLETLSDDQMILADADIDGDVNIKDATYIQKMVAGLVKPAVPTNPQETTMAITTVNQTTVTEEGTTQFATEGTEASTAVTDPTETSIVTTVPATTAPDYPTESTLPTQLTDPTEETRETTAPPVPTTMATDPEEPTVEPTTRDKNKPIELPFVPAY